MFNYIKNKLKKPVQRVFSNTLSIRQRVGVRAFKNNHCKGYSLLELVLAMAVGVIVIAGGYSSYVIIAKQYQRVSAFSEVQQAGIATLMLMSRDLRMAGREAMNVNIDPVYGDIAAPITITDSGNACCDRIVIIYDKDSIVNPRRCQITYSIAPRTNAFAVPLIPARNALYMTVATLFSDPGDVCTGDGTTSLVADYVDDMQLVGSDNDTNGNPRLVDISLILRSQSAFNKTINYARPAQTIGNWNWNSLDNFHRDEFTATLNIKNLRN